MDPNQTMHIDTNTGTLSETSSLLCDTPEIRPYQAYCATEISSCPSSQENLAPSLLRVKGVYPKQIDMSAQASIIGAFEQGDSLTRVATSNPDEQVDSPKSVPATNYTGKQNQRMNQRSLIGSTSSATVTSDHITQPINPRGNHLVAEDEVTAYEFDPAITRVQPLRHINCVTERTIPRKPVPGDGEALGIIYRPLPKIPLEKVKLESQDRPESTYEHGCVQCPPQTPDPTDKRLEERDGKTSLRCCQGVYDVPCMSSSDPPSYDKISAAVLRLLPGDLSLSGPASLSYNAHVRHCIQTAQVEFGDTHTRRFLSTELGNSQGNTHDTDDKATAGSPDRFEDIDLESPNAQLLPPRSLDPTFQTRFHQGSLGPFLQTPTYTRPHHAPSFHSSTDLQNGPRPPPWGSYDNLALQRRQRNQLRGRAHNVTINVVRETTLTYQRTLSVEGRGEGLSREVNEYREQILSVYPDMAFDGNSGGNEREWECCLVM